MVSHKSYDINANEDFVILLPSEMKSQSTTTLVSGGAHTHTHTEDSDLKSEVHSIWDLP
jgi:hypothetical protein